MAELIVTVVAVVADLGTDVAGWARDRLRRRHRRRTGRRPAGG